jgi:hypothetical protein
MMGLDVSTFSRTWKYKCEIRIGLPVLHETANYCVMNCSIFAKANREHVGIRL